ncbi:MAG: restriction endonuclease subunit S [Prevotella sp.]|nr:restriction endonuclease subunit S [Prevotella sp.]
MEKVDKIIPLRRFPGFADDEEWKELKFSDIAQFYKGKGISKNDVTGNGSVPCIRYGELYTHYKEVIDNVTSYTDLPIDDLFMSKANDVIIPSSGETKEDIATASCVLHDNVALGGDINVIRTTSNGVFLSYYLNNAKKHDIAKIAQGISIIHLYNEQLRNLSIELPDLEEQQKIAECLSSIDSYISSINEKVEQLKAHKKSLMQKLFPKRGQTVPEYRFSEFWEKGEWKKKRLGDCIKMKNGYAFKSSTYITSGKFKIITIRNVKNGYLEMKEYNTLNNLPSDIQHHQILKKGNILISMTGNVGRVCMVDVDDCLLNQRVGLIDINTDNVDKDFIFAILTDTSFEKAMIESGQGAAQANIGNKDIEDYCFLCPESLNEQHRIAMSLSSIEKMTRNTSDKIFLLNQYKKGLMQQLFPKK